jgi:hypothetical protein
VGQNQLAVELPDKAIALLSSVAPRKEGWNDQHHRLGAHLGLVGAAVAAHCAVGGATGAEEIAESAPRAGRGQAHLDDRGARGRLPGLGVACRGHSPDDLRPRHHEDRHG